MPEHTIKFTLPEEQLELRMAIEGSRAHAMLCCFQGWLLARYKHEDPKSSEVREEFEAVKKEFFEELEDHGVDLEG